MIKYTSVSELRNTIFQSPFDKNLDEKNRWIILEQLIPWDQMAHALMEGMSDLGRGSINLRLALGALLVKGIENLSDEATIQYIQENIYSQYFVGLRSFQPEALFTPEVFVSIRKRLGEEGIRLINDIFLKYCHEENFIQHRKKHVSKEEKEADGVLEDYEEKVEEKKEGERGSKYTNRGQLLMDATVCPQDIAYPLDTKLLNWGRLVLEEIIDVYHTAGLFGEKKPRTYRRIAKQKYLNLAKQKHPSIKAIKKCRKQQLQYIRRDMRYLNELFDEWESRGKGIPRLPKDLYKKFLAVVEMYRQQKEMHEDGRRRIDDRIVNIAQPYVRPIKRGKAGKKTEFGPKINISSTEGYVRMDRVDYNNFNESTDMIGQINAYKWLYGYYPASVLVDKIYLTRENRKFLKYHDIEHYGTRLGRPREESKEEKRKRQKKQNKRSRIEGHFGLGKRKYGLDKIKMRRIDTSKCHIGLILLSMNVMHMLHDVFIPLFLLSRSIICALERAIWGIGVTLLQEKNELRSIVNENQIIVKV